jgi:ethanolamine utilization protein EutQ (cupin superfamily)
MVLLVFKNVLDTKTEKVDLGKGAAFAIKDVLTPKDSFGSFSAGIFEGKGKFDLDYTFDEIALILEGKLELTDRETKQTKVLQKGDIFHITKGSKITFNSPGYKEFYICHPPFVG